MGHDATNIDLLRKAYNHLVETSIYCLGAATMLDEETGNEFRDIMVKHCDVIVAVEELIKSKGGEVTKNE